MLDSQGLSTSDSLDSMGLVLQPTGSKGGQYTRLGFLEITPVEIIVQLSGKDLAILDPSLYLKREQGGDYIIEII
jgi:hypothetical protein